MRRVASLRDLLPDLGKRTLVMGILNVTPDSFSDGGQFSSVDAIVQRARQMQNEGTDMWDVGGESTRPGALLVSPNEELRRVLLVIERLAARPSPLPISLDTTKASVAQAGIDAGANLINDISAGTLDPALFSVVAEARIPICLMHLPVVPSEMGWSRAGGGMDENADIINAVVAFLQERVSAAVAAGIARDDILVDPGFGFGKSARQNLALVHRAHEIKNALGGLPLLIGVSRKSTIARVLGADAERDDPDRLAGTAALTALSIAGGADIVRVHDVGFMARVVRVADATVRGV